MDGVSSNKLTSQSLSEAVKDQLMRLIAQGALKPGDRLNEVHLAERFGISRGPVREAARELEGAGVLLSRPRQGFFVAGFTPREILDIYEAKRWMEEAFISDLAAHTDVATRKSVLADVDSIDDTDRVSFSETLLQFRLRMCAHINNRFLAELMAALYRKFYIIGAVLTVTENEDRQAWIVSVLRRFWAAMIDGDLSAAHTIMVEDTAHWLADLPPRFVAKPNA